MTSTLGRRLLIGGVLLLLTMQYLIAEQVTAAAWSNPAYSFGRNYISDLGVPECVKASDRGVCSPDHALMNGAFVTQGLIVLAAAAVLTGLLGRGWRQAVRALALVYGVGMIIVGSFPGSYAENLTGDATRTTLHSIGALLAILGGNLLILAVGAGVRHTSPRLGVLSLVLGVVGIGAGFASRTTTLGLGVGGIERLAVYPFILWFIVAGALLVRTSRSATPESSVPDTAVNAR
ncbi:DUF998 domain-containing protein [Dermacoccaceae bacterium W4C1]